ncbi:aspartate/glutamate racemase family protein [Candidatus Bipolaricaulota bacterium]|nr:aspartate/glutamate racemase family protein [Candidatus Bipolaricaulota bacterium]
MKTIGLLGGMSWESTLSYYQLINQGIKAALGGLHSASIAMVSVDFDPIAKLQHNGDWESMARLLVQAARQVEAAGADFLMICTNTMHELAPVVEDSIGIPLLHIADATASVLVEQGTRTVGLLGTAFTMERRFYKDRLAEKHGIDVLIPDKADRRIVHDTIYRELCLGRQETRSKEEFLRIIDRLADQGAQAVILGCTEIGMLVSKQDTDVMLLDTTAIHAKTAVALALASGSDVFNGPQHPRIL